MHNISTLTKHVLEQLKRVPDTDTGVIVALSGGPDSTAMLALLCECSKEYGIPRKIHVAHLNHGTRGADSDADQKHAQSLAEQFGCEFHTERIDLPVSDECQYDQFQPLHDPADLQSEPGANGIFLRARQPNPRH